jgi:hypothetical protein
VLLAGLYADDLRVREDAALALPLEPDLLAADPAQRQTIATALDAAVAVEARGMVALVAASVHLRLREAIDVLLPRYLAGEAIAAERLFASALLQIDQEAVAACLMRSVAQLTTPLARARAAYLLYDMDVPAAQGPLLELLRRSGERGIRARACAALLRQGVAEAELAAQADAELLDLARQLARPRPPRLRTIKTE